MLVDIKTHILRVHEGVKKYQCEHCPARFASNYGVKKHVEMIHTDSERVQCVECKGSFKVSSLEGHVQRVHRGVKNAFPCPEEECGKVFVSKAHLDRHVLSLHKKWKASCPECGKKIRVKFLVTLRFCIGESIHSREGVECKQVLFSEASMMKHVEKHHLGEGWETVPCPECSAVLLPCHLANHIHTAHT